MKKVLATVVTYNRIELLKRCISYLSNQTVRPDILVINNSSSDGTEEFLIREKIDHVTQPNGGSSSGWWRGIKEAAERNYDYAWLMDDDGFPDLNALQLLVAQMTDDISCLSSVVVKEQMPSEFVFGMPVLNKKGDPVLFSFKRKYSDFDHLPKNIDKYPFAHLFNGALLNLKLIEKIGNVDRSYFLYGDEIDYFCRLRQAGKVFSLVTALHYHPDVNRRKIDKWRVYYFIRNTIILNKRYFDHTALRNLFTVGVAWVRILKRDGLIVSLSYLMGGNSKYFYYGIKDGLKQNLIKRY